MKEIKCVVVGDGEIGKTCLLLTYGKNEFPKEYAYVPTILESYQVVVNINDEPVQLDLFDTAGQEDFDRLRILSYHGADVVLVCFSVVDPISFENIEKLWAPEILKYCPNIPFLIVGTKIDLRDGCSKISPVGQDQGEKLAKELRAVKYVECSALTQDGLKNVFDNAIMSTMKQNDGGNNCCSIL